MGNAAKGNEPSVIALLVTVIDGAARKDSVAIVLVGGNGTDASIRCSPGGSPIGGLREVCVRHVAETCRVIPGIVKRQVDAARNGIDRKPMIEAVNFVCELISHFASAAPRGAFVG